MPTATIATCYLSGNPPACPPGLLPHHWAELQASGIAEDVAAANVASWGPGTDRHWEHEREAITRHKREAIDSTPRTPRNKAWHGHSSGGWKESRWALDRRYRHLQAGGWRSLSDTLPGLPVFDQWKPNTPRLRKDKPGRSIKYEAPPGFPDGGGLLLPRVPDRCWELICDRHGLPVPDDATRAAGFWAWALATPDLPLVIAEGWKKALALISAGWAAVALPGVTMGRRIDADGSARLIPALQALAAPARRWLIAFDAEAKHSTAAKVGAAAGRLAYSLRCAGSRVEIARLPLLPGTEKTGLDDLLAAAGPEALDRALATTGPRAVLPTLRPADRVAAAGQWLGVACPIPAPEAAPLVILQAPMGCGKTEAIAQALAPLAAAGVPLLLPSHRTALGQAAAESIGIPWCPAPGSDARLQGVAGCWDSWCLDSGLRINATAWDGAVITLDEWMQALEHLLLSTGTALGKNRRAAALRTLTEQLPRMRQIIAADAQMADWGVRLLERLTGHTALVIASNHRPMAGRPLHCPEGLRTAAAAADAFRSQWAQLVADGRPFLCWTTAQKARICNAPQTLAKLHKQRRPDARVLVIDSSTPEAAAELAADPDGVAARFDAIYCSPSISSGISFRTWKPAAVIAYAGGRIAPEHAAQALARVRSPEVPAYLFAPERCPGRGLRVGSGDTKPDRLIAHLKATTDPLLGVLEHLGPDGVFLEAWAELGATRNRQRFAYRATIAGLLEREGWELQAPGPAPCPVAGAQATADLKEITTAAQAAEDADVINAPTLTPEEAQALARRRRLEPADRAALDRHQLSQRWGLGAAAPSLSLLEADRDGMADRLRLGWLLTTPAALALIPGLDQARTAALDPAGRPFSPDRSRVTLAPRIAALQALGVPGLLERFSRGETIAATDPAVLELHTHATTHRPQLVAAAGVSPGVKASGTLRALLAACGWKLERAGRVKARGTDRDALTYRATRQALPEGVNPEALAAVWLAELQTAAATAPAGALFAPIEKPCRGEKCPTRSPSHPPPRRLPWPLAPVVAIPWPGPPPRPPRSAALAAA